MKNSLNIATKSKFKAVPKCHLKKLDKFRKRKTMTENEKKPFVYIKHTVQNFSSYVLSDEEFKTFSYGLDHHIPTYSNYNAVETEFECFVKTFSQIFSIFPKTN